MDQLKQTIPIDQQVPCPYNEELRMKALVAALNYASFEGETTPFVAYDFIEELQNLARYPLRAHQAIAMYRAMLRVGVEPDEETWCAGEPVFYEDPAKAHLRLTIQQQFPPEKGKIS